MILGLLSMIGGLIGLAAAVKLSAVVATHLKTDLHLSSRWLPVIAFFLVFLGVVLLIRWIGGLLEGLVKMALLGWVNKLAGIGLFVFLYLSVYSILLFYGTQSQFISRQAVDNSHFYSLIAPLGPAVIRFISSFIPFGQDMFKALEGFFDRIAGNMR